MSLIYAITFSLAKDVMPEYIKGFGFIVLRVCGAAILFGIASLFAKKEKINWKLHGPRILLCSVLGVMANMLMFFKGLEITTPINAAVLMLATPIFVLLLNSVINKQAVLLSQFAGIMLATFGCLFLMSGKGFSFNARTMPGDILVLINAIFYAGYLVFAKELFNHYHTLTVSKYTFLFGAILVIPFGWSELREARFEAMDFEIIAKILFVIIFTTFVTYLLNAWSILKAGPTLVGAYIYLQPILAAIIAILLKKDELNMQKILAILFIFAGVFITSTKTKWYKSKA